MNSDEIPYEGLESLVENFLRDRQKEYLILEESLKQKDYATIKSYMHKWKGFCEPYGFGPLARISIDMETLAAAESYDGCTQSLVKIKAYLDKRSAQLNT